MADISTNEATLKIENYFVDGDTRTITLKNPKSDISTSDIAELETFMRTNNIIVGDKMAEKKKKIEKVTRINTTKTYLDFTS